MRSRTASTGLWTLFTLAVLVGGAPAARASTLNPIYTVAYKLDLLPNPQAATSVMIHGAFFFYQNGGTYSAPRCGYMYFTCPQGSEAMCRQQWTDILTISKNQQCAGFGQQLMVSTATLYKEGDPPGKPDVWDLGMGVSGGVWVDGKCDPAKMLNCGGVTPPPDMATPPPPPDLSTTPPPDLSKPAEPVDMAVAKPVDLAVAPKPADLSQPPQVAPPGSCSVGSGRAAPWSMMPLVLLAGIALRRRRRR